MTDGDSIKDLLDHSVAPGNVGSPAEESPEPRPPRHGLRVWVTWGDLTAVAADVHVVGHYQDVLPAAAEAALDAAISTGAPRSIIAEHTRRRWLVGQLGEVAYFPSAHDTVRIPAVAGLGRHGTFTEHRAVQLYTSLLTELAMLSQAQRVATVLIGSGAGNLTVDAACQALVVGFGRALSRLQSAPEVTDVVVTELDRLRAEQILDALRRATERHPDTGVEIRGPVETAAGGIVSTPAAAVYGVMAMAALAAAAPATSGNAQQAGSQHPLDSVLDAVDDELRELVRARLGELAGLEARDVDRKTRGLAIGTGLNDRGGQAKPVRISVLSASDSVCWAALSDYASVPERRLAKAQLFEDLVARLNNPSAHDAARLAELLSRIIIPTDFHALVTDQSPLVLEVDRTTAPMHWELIADLGQQPDTRTLPLVLRTAIARQLRTEYAQVLTEPATTTTLRALVIGDPGEGRASLVGARQEAKQVRTALQRLGVEVTTYIGAPTASREDDLAGIPPATRLEVLGELLSGQYEIVHFCGHGTFDEVDPERRAGWVFADGLLTSRELVQLTEPPRLVVANACYTSVVSRSPAAAPSDNTLASARPADAALTPGLADEFLRAGVVHYIGAAWPIHDAAGPVFAHELYQQLLAEGATVGTALCASRNTLWESREEWGVSWAAYQHYGDPTDCVQATTVHADD